MKPKIKNIPITKIDIYERKCPICKSTNIIQEVSRAGGVYPRCSNCGFKHFGIENTKMNIEDKICGFLILIGIVSILIMSIIKMIEEKQYITLILVLIPIIFIILAILDLRKCIKQ